MAGRAATKWRGHKLVLRERRAPHVQPQHRNIALALESRGSRGPTTGQTEHREARRVSTSGRRLEARGTMRVFGVVRSEPSRARNAHGETSVELAGNASEQEGKGKARLAKAKGDTPRNGRALRVTPTIRPCSDFARQATCALHESP